MVSCVDKLIRYLVFYNYTNTRGEVISNIVDYVTTLPPGKGAKREVKRAFAQDFPNACIVFLERQPLELWD